MKSQPGTASRTGTMRPMKPCGNTRYFCENGRQALTRENRPMTINQDIDAVRLLDVRQVTEVLYVHVRTIWRMSAATRLLEFVGENNLQPSVPTELPVANCLTGSSGRRHALSVIIVPCAWRQAALRCSRWLQGCVYHKGRPAKDFREDAVRQRYSPQIHHQRVFEPLAEQWEGGQ